MTKGQKFAVDQLQEIADVSDGLLEIISIAEWSGFTKVETAIYCGSIDREPDGLPLRDRERFFVLIPSDFPFDIPTVLTRHIRFAGFPHVQWKRSLCLYQSPATEWNPSDGMFGFIDRLNIWLKQGALGQLAPIGAPLHPPVTYTSSGPFHTVIPRADTPLVGIQPWSGVAHLRVVSDRRVDIYGWSGIGESAPSPVGTAILLSQPMPYEFPSKLSDLLAEFEARGVSRDILLLSLQNAVLWNDEADPLYLIIGTPMRGIAGSRRLHQHLAAWYINPTLVKGLRISLGKFSDCKNLQDIGKKAEKIIMEWMEKAPVEWCQVREDRPEIVVRRDIETSVNWFTGKRVALWGCGALGGPIAEFLARAGIGKLILRDKGVVAPGLLVRQPFDDRDIGRTKAEVLAERIKRIRPDLEVDYFTNSILNEPLECEDWTEEVDVIIDTTASVSVMQKFELVRRTSTIPSIPVASLMIGHRAEKGLLVLAREKYSGGPRDLYRRAKIEACNRSYLKHFADEFWPDPSRTKIFQPEPGCSESTFVGSAADVTVLAGAMLNRLAYMLVEGSSTTASAYFLTQPHLDVNTGQNAYASFDWDDDQVSQDPHSGYEIRIAASAWSEIRGWIRQNQRTDGPDVETGGLLFGERDDASRIVWVTEAIGPPPDSQKSAKGFVCGIEGTKKINDKKRDRTRRAIQYIGMWHTHPSSSPFPSPTDFCGMKKIISSINNPTPKSLLLIVGNATEPETSTIGTFVFKRSEFKEIKNSIQVRGCSIQTACQVPKPRRIGLSLSGGGSRAIAFHLGCLRALHDRNILDQIRVISTVSGGSIIGAMYAYSNVPFEEFEKRVLSLLRQGLFRPIVYRLLLSPTLVKSVITMAISGMPAMGAEVLRWTLKKGTSILEKQDKGRLSWIDNIQPPLCRWSSRTSAFEAVLRHKLFGDMKVTDERRDAIDVIINSGELRTGSAFRFGSKESGCWRFGQVLDNDIQVAQAVAASAAYPVFLPAIDRTFTFVDRTSNQSLERVILTDGGVFDNLGITCLEPGRLSELSYNVFESDYIICCNAGQGLFSDHVHPYWLLSQMKRSFESIFRKTQDQGYQRLHNYVVSGALKGFILPYLGQKDSMITLPDLVSREEVLNYPTNFSAMSEEYIERLTKRGEQLTRWLIDRYTPEL